MLFETKVEASGGKTLFDVHRWPRDGDTAWSFSEVVEKPLGPVFPIGMHTEEPLWRMYMWENTQDWTNSFFQRHQTMACISQFVDYLWTSSRVYLEASTFVSTTLAEFWYTFKQFKIGLLVLIHFWYRFDTQYLIPFNVISYRFPAI